MVRRRGRRADVQGAGGAGGEARGQDHVATRGTEVLRRARLLCAARDCLGRVHFLHHGCGAGRQAHIDIGFCCRERRAPARSAACARLRSVQIRTQTEQRTTRSRWRMSWMEAVTKCTTFSRASSRSTTATAHLKVRMEVWWLFRRARRRDDLLGAPKCTFECNTCEWTEWTEWTYTSMNYSYSLHCLRPISQ